VAFFAIEKRDSDLDKDLDAGPFSEDSGTGTACDSGESGSKSQLLGFLSYQTFPGLGELHILRLAVPLVHRRKGYGTQLLRWACSKTSSLGLKSVWLFTKPKSEAFYERLGFFNMGYMSDPSLSPEKDDGERYSWMMLNV
jgi:ribosomal protein S18 acetylase RimI-like enzyme